MFKMVHDAFTIFLCEWLGFLCWICSSTLCGLLNSNLVTGFQTLCPLSALYNIPPINFNAQKLFFTHLKIIQHFEGLPSNWDFKKTATLEMVWDL